MEEDKETKIKLDSFFKEIRDIDNFKDIVLTMYLAEFEENIYLILKLKAEFYDYLQEKVNFVVAEKYSNEVFSNSTFIKINEEIKNVFLDDYYNPINDFLTEKVEQEYFLQSRHKSVNNRKTTKMLDCSNNKSASFSSISQEGDINKSKYFNLEQKKIL